MTSRVEMRSFIRLAHPRPTPTLNSSSSVPFFLRGAGTTCSVVMPLLINRRNITRGRKSPVFSISFKSCSYSTYVVAQSKQFEEEKEEEPFSVVSFYCFVSIEDPQDLVFKHLTFLQGLDIRGRIYVNEQGINAQYSGPSTHTLAYVEWLREDCRFSDVFVQISPGLGGHAFPRLKVQYKPSLVQLEGGISHLPLLDSSMRATPLAPSEWRKRLVDGASSLNLNRKFILLDVRNGYEWDIGHFHGAQRPDVGCFRSTSFGLSHSEEITSDPLVGVDRESTDVLMYCTGGIRCDIYSTVLRQKGFKNLFTLKGGVSHYLKEEGPVKWMGNLFVFDSRLSLPPSAYKPDSMNRGSEQHLEYEHSTFARCYICRSYINELKHRNCANIDCNRLFLCCNNCLIEVHGCCCVDCTSATRLRPILPRNQRYEKWHIYRDLEQQKSY